MDTQEFLDEMEDKVGAVAPAYRSDMTVEQERLVLVGNREESLAIYLVSIRG